MPHSTISLSSDDVDDLIYYSRTGDLDSLKEAIETFSKTHSCSSYSILTAAIDVDEDGLGSGSCLLHYPSANGSLEVVTYLLSLIVGKPESTIVSTGQSSEGDASQTAFSTPTFSASNFVNRQNASGNTPLHWAGMNGHLAIVQALIRAGADPEIVNGAGRDAVVESEWSSKDGAAECAVWILKECDVLEKGVGDSIQEEGASGRMDENTEVGVENNDEIVDDEMEGRRGTGNV